jgi:hypothetical protein
VSARRQSPVHVWRCASAGPELWKLPPTGDPVRVDTALKKCRPLVASAPTRSLLSMPLWVAAQGNARDLAELEMASRHLVRKGCRVGTATIETGPDRSLVLAVVASDDPLLVALAGCASCFEAPARLRGSPGHDLLLWREEGILCFGFYRAGRCVYFSTAGDAPLGAQTAAAIHRCALRLVAEEVLPSIPARALLLGTFSREEAAALAPHTAADVAPEPPPSLPETPLDFPPPMAVAARSKRKRTARLAVIITIAAAFYLLLLAVITADTSLRALRLQEVEKELRAQSPPAERARTETLRWQAIRRAVHPEDFLLDVLAAVVRTIPAENMRLTQFTFQPGLIFVSGEAADVGQSYEMLERLKATPSLAGYEWSSRPPQIAGAGTVRFELEGRRSDARTDSD